jgi:hypothetical protein
MFMVLRNAGFAEDFAVQKRRQAKVFARDA